jgi:hypothetical protein
LTLSAAPSARCLACPIALFACSFTWRLASGLLSRYFLTPTTIPATSASPSSFPTISFPSWSISLRSLILHPRRQAPLARRLRHPRRRGPRPRRQRQSAPLGLRTQCASGERHCRVTGKSDSSRLVIRHTDLATFHLNLFGTHRCGFGYGSRSGRRSAVPAADTDFLRRVQATAETHVARVRPMSH